MSETFEISGGSPAPSVVSENGKKYYYLNAPLPPPPVPAQESQAPNPGPLNFQEHTNRFAHEQSGPLHYYGENMVVRNARTMFNNVDILADGRYFCCVCRRPYKTHATLSAHLRGSHLRQESPCPEQGCNHVSVTENERRKHQKWHDKMKYSSMTREQLRAPRKMESSILEPRTPSENVLREQIVRNTREVTGMKMEEDKRGKLKYSCTHCDESFNNAYRATRHTELHGNSPKRCFYCGEIRKGTMDLHVHYMRFHKNEGIRTISCTACNRAFTSTTLFRNHANQPECQIACQNSLVRQDIYYGELPPGTMIDDISMNRLNFFRKRQEEREQMQMGGATRETVRHQMHNYQSPPTTSDAAASSDIFDESSNTLIQTEFGLKNFAEFKTSRAAKRRIDHDQFDTSKVKREPVENHYRDEQHHQHPTTTTQSQQQNMEYPADYIHPPPSYGYDPLIGTYPDYQPMQQFNNFPSFPDYYPPYAFYTHSEMAISVKQEEVTPEKETVNNDSSSRQYRLGSTSGIASDLLVNQQGDVVFEELDKLDFVMPENNSNTDNDVADLEGMFNF